VRHTGGEPRDDVAHAVRHDVVVREKREVDRVCRGLAVSATLFGASPRPLITRNR